MERIKRFALPAEPSSFELWFYYATGANSQLNRVIDEAIASPDGLTEAKFDRLCSNHLSSKRDSSHLKTISTDLSDEIGQVMGMLQVATKSTGAYERQLGDGLVSFGVIQDGEAAKPIVEALVVATRQMEAETQTLKLQLNSSQSRAARLQQEVDVLRQENLTDALTLTGNRQYFDEALAHLTAAAVEPEKPLSLLFCDIDHFKCFNDKHGHQVGDQVLRLVANLIKDSLREDDVVARYGGEEFGVILPQTSLDLAKTTAERIRAALAAREVKMRHGKGSFGRITISIGVAQLRLNESPYDLVHRADNCLYAAKRLGRNRVFSEEEAMATA